MLNLTIPKENAMTTTTAQTVTIETEEKYGDGVRSSKREHVLEFMGNRYGLVFVPAGVSARRVTQGPMVAGPWADGFELGSYITADRKGSGYVAACNRSNGTEHTVEVGDQVVIDGVTFTVAAGKGYRPDYLRLVGEAN